MEVNMVDIEKLDDELYIAAYGLPKVGNYKELWINIKNNPEILRAAVKLKRDKFDERDLVKGLAISEAMLIDYEMVDEIAYNELIDSIYSNTDIARIVINGASNGGYSFLLMSLWNPNLKLTKEQKAFAENEAMNKIGTTHWKERKDNYSQKLDKMGISDDNITLINIDGSINPIGEKNGTEYINYLVSSISDEQAHGIGAFDIRYCILKNPNWNLAEKQKLIMDFWYDDEEYDAYLEEWEWNIVNDPTNYKGEILPIIDKDELFEYTYDMLLRFYDDKKMADRIWAEIQFCKQMHELRPQHWELEHILKR